jgi:hypothetical protein
METRESAIPTALSPSFHSNSAIFLGGMNFGAPDFSARATLKPHWPVTAATTTIPTVNAAVRSPLHHGQRMVRRQTICG